MARIFISYRREGAAGFSGRLGEDLERRFGAGEVFRDVEDITSGDDFVERLAHALQDCRVLLAVIDKTWLSTNAGSRRRLDDPKDFVRTEIARALARGVRVIPVLVDGATMPAERDLPDDLKSFARRQAHDLSDSRWDYDVERLASVVQTALTGDMKPPGSGTTNPRRRWLAGVAVVAGLIAIAAVGWYGYSRPPDLNGTWDLPDGSYWIIQQSGRNLGIDVVHYQSRQVWQRGRGAIDGNEIAFNLQLVYETAHSLEGRLGISGDAKRLTGVAVNSPSGNRTPIILQRR
jgi:hypothetical protein